VANRKKIAQELKRPDQFVDFWTHALQRVAQVVGPRRKPAIAVAVALGVVLVGASVFNVWDQNRRVGVSQSLAHVQRIANAELLSDATNPKDDASKSDVPRFKTAQERGDAVLKELDVFLTGRSSRGLMNEARLMKGATLLGLGRSDDAIKAYENALIDNLDVRLRFLAHEGIGYAYEAKGDLDKALSAFGQIAGDAKEFGGFYEDRGLYHRARLTAAKGDKPGAVTLYRQILDKAPDPAMKSEITDRLAVLEAK
jgi:tetratricopeptide (TPR) repeat protein